MAHFIHSLIQSLGKYDSSLPLLKIFDGTTESPSWNTITYGAFRDDLEKTAFHWVHALAAADVQLGSVVGLWITGTRYRDLVNLYAIARAGFIPQVFSLNFRTPMIIDLLATSKGKALLYCSSFGEHVKDFDIPILVVPELDTIPKVTAALPDLPEVEDTDMAMIFHTSGSTSGRPKPIPETHRWLKYLAQKQWARVWQGDFKTQPMFNNVGSFANVGSATIAFYLSFSGQCLVQSSKPDFPASELLAMVDQGLNGLMIYAPWLSKLITLSRTDSGVLAALKALAQINYTGAAMNPEDEIWMAEQGIPVANMYATTETGICLVSNIAEKSTIPLMRLVPGSQCQFIPASDDLDKVDLDGDTVERFKGGKLYDLFIPEYADNCPHPWIRNRPDGHVTGDLFEEVQPGYYAFRGRSDDWIRTGKDLSFCDTKSIEDNILRVCADVVKNCAVVGHYKPGVVLFVEPVLPFDPETQAESLKTEILQRTAEFSSKLYAHERITDPVQIVIAASGSLARTAEKGNIRRKAVEEDYKNTLDEIYSHMKPR
ncbi:acetyl-CoA synthetase-like protein [Mycena floridula]|nr:acetyl-CoA synthetase-like protein [Mycena floridula]